MILFEMFDEPAELTLIDALRDFLPIAVELLELTSLPKINLVSNVGQTEHPTFGKFINDAKVIQVNIENRNPNDILRTLAHELTHYAQGINGMLNDASGNTGSAEENEANAVAGIIMRNFNQQYPKYLRLAPVVIEKHQ